MLNELLFQSVKFILGEKVALDDAYDVFLSRHLVVCLVLEG